MIKSTVFRVYSVLFSKSTSVLMSSIPYFRIA